MGIPPLGTLTAALFASPKPPRREGGSTNWREISNLHLVSRELSTVFADSTHAA